MHEGRKREERPNEEKMNKKQFWFPHILILPPCPFSLALVSCRSVTFSRVEQPPCDPVPLSSSGLQQHARARVLGRGPSSPQRPPGNLRRPVSSESGFLSCRLHLRKMHRRSPAPPTSTRACKGPCRKTVISPIPSLHFGPSSPLPM